MPESVRRHLDILGFNRRLTRRILLWSLLVGGLASVLISAGELFFPIVPAWNSSGIRLIQWRPSSFPPFKPFDPEMLYDALLRALRQGRVATPVAATRVAAAPMAPV